MMVTDDGEWTMRDESPATTAYMEPLLLESATLVWSSMASSLRYLLLYRRDPDYQTGYPQKSTIKWQGLTL